MFSQNGPLLSQNGIPILPISQNDFPGLPVGVPVSQNGGPYSQNGLPLPSQNPIAPLLDQNGGLGQNGGGFDQNVAAGLDHQNALRAAAGLGQNSFAPHPGVGNGLIPPTRAHSSFIASVLSHLIGAHQGGLVGQMLGGHVPQVIHGFGPQGPVVGHPGYHPAPSSALGLVPAHPSHIVQALLAALHGHQQAAPPSNVNQPI